MLRKLVIIALLSMSSAYAWQWPDLWKTPDKKGQDMMMAGQYEAAEKTFQREDWRATAAFRAKNYQQAASLFLRLNQPDGYYNAGNALAHLRQYKAAIQAYDKALALNPKHADAQYNRSIVEKLLKKQQDQEQNKQQKENQEKQDQSDSNSSDQSKPNQKQDNQPDQKQPDNPEQNHHKNPEQAKQEPKQKQETKPDHAKPEEAPEKVNAKREQQQAKNQWLRLIPDEPGNLLREKFLRDYLRRRGGE